MIGFGEIASRQGPAGSRKPGSRRPAAAMVLVLACSLFAAAPAWAAGSVLSGVFDGSEPVLQPPAAGECAPRYRQSVFQVDRSGRYSFYDALGALSSFAGINVIAEVHEGSFDAAAPGRNLLASEEYDFEVGEVNLAAGATYVLVVRQACAVREGAWAVTFTGPGTVSSESAVAVPSFTAGAFTEADLVMHNYCDDGWGSYPQFARSRQSGPIRVSRDGIYYFADAPGFNGLCLSVHTAPVNPAAPGASLVGALGWYGLVELRAGQDYYFVIQQGYSPEYLFILAPPAPFRMNPGLADSWYNPDTPGQGFFLDVFEQLNQVFLGWFTYASEPVAGDDPGHRWMTAFGPFAGTSAELALTWTGGGGFDRADPTPGQDQDGRIELEFTDCRSGRISYSWGSDAFGAPVVSGVIPIERIANDSVALCERLFRGPGTPGPL